MKKIVLILVLILSSLNMGNASAANLSHKQMSEIYGQGYNNALLETVVEVNAKASTRLEENRNLLTQYYDDTKGYINQRIQDYGNVKNFGELLIEQASGAMTLTDGVIDLLTGLFKGDEDEGTDNTPKECTKQVTQNGSDSFGGWTASLNCGVYYDASLVTLGLTVNGNEQTGYFYSLVFVAGGTYRYSREVGRLAFPSTFAQFQSYLTMMKPDVPSFYDLRLKLGNQYLFEEKEINPSQNFYTNHFRNLRSNPSTRQPIYIPQLKPKLSCPDGDKVVQIDGRGGFVHANGVPVDSSGCTVYWQKPNVTVDDDGKVLLTDPDTGETIDAGLKPPNDKIPVEDKGEGCDGVLCFLGAVTSMIADLISSILGLVGDLLEGILRLFVPSDLNFLSEEFNRVTAALQQKISITEDLKGAIKGLFVESGTNPLNDIVIDMPAMSEPVSFREFTFIETGVPILKRIIGAIFTLYTIFYVYRKIVGQGGIMEK